MTPKDIQIIQNLVGDFTDSHLDNLMKNLEFYVHKDISLFVPIYRHCDYAVLPDHSHPSYSFIYNFKLNGHFYLDGKKITPKKTSSPFICAFSPDVIHHEVIEEGFSNYIAVCIRKEYFEQELSTYTNEPLFFYGDFFPANESLLHLLKMAMLEHNNSSGKKENVISSLNILIAHAFIRMALEKNKHKTTADPQNKIEIAIAYMYSHIDEKILVEKIAEHVNLSLSHFNKLFKESTKKTPVEYLTQIRIEKAKRLLKLTDKNLTEIAFDCGFSSSSYFSHSFIDRIHLTPSEYRKLFGKK